METANRLIIKRLRSQILIHSYLYYVLDNPIVSDAKFDSWSEQLVGYGEVEIFWYDHEFKDWDGSSGYHFKYDAWIRDKATQLLDYHLRIGK